MNHNKQYGAGPARPLVAAFLRAGQVEMVAQGVEQGHSAIQLQPPRALGWTMDCLPAGRGRSMRLDRIA
jgi:hypothetical protein